MAFAQFQRESKQLVRALEARGRHFQPASEAKISVSQLEQEGTEDTVNRLALLPKRLRLLGERRLMLTEARMLFNSGIIDTLCSILKRLEWAQFCIQPPIATRQPAWDAMSRALDCIYALLGAWRRVGPLSFEASSDWHTAKAEALPRCCFVAREEYLQTQLRQAGELEGVWRPGSSSLAWCRLYTGLFVS